MKGSDIAPETYAVITRCVSRILYTYYDLVDLQELNPSWPQLARLAICGQLLILICDAGELQGREEQNLFGTLVYLLELHRNSWPVCEQLIAGVSGAAKVLGIDLSKQTNALNGYSLTPAALRSMPNVGGGPTLSGGESSTIPDLTSGDMSGSQNPVVNPVPFNIEELFLGTFEGFPWYNGMFSIEPSNSLQGYNAGDSGNKDAGEQAAIGELDFGALDGNALSL